MTFQMFCTWSLLMCECVCVEIRERFLYLNENEMRAHFPYKLVYVSEENVTRKNTFTFSGNSVCVCGYMYTRLICCPAKFLTLVIFFPKYPYHHPRKSAPPGKRLKAPNFIVRTRFHSFCFLFAFFIMYCCFIKCIIRSRA